MKNKDKLKTKKYRGGDECKIVCDTITHPNLNKLCEDLGGITNLIEPFIDKKNPLYKNEREYTDDELASMNKEYDSIIQNNCGVSIADYTSSSDSTTNDNKSNTNQISNTNQSNINQSNICDNNNPIINIADNTNYTILNNTLKQWNSCKNNNKILKIQYPKLNNDLNELIKKYKTKKIAFVNIKTGGTRRRKKTKKRKTNKRKHNK